jgi:FMN phosphatase YigB (HAD superfamily)
MPQEIVFLFDVDNTLLDNDRVSADLKRHLTNKVGAQQQARYWAIFEELRTTLGYADYLGALQRYRVENPREPHLLTVSEYLINSPFTKRLFPKALNVVEHVTQWGPAVILSDGDVVFQPRKVDRAGIRAAVDGNVLIYIHKELELEDVRQRFPAQHYVLVDDKLRILTAVKEVWGNQVTTVFVRQGHYALDREVLSKYPCADLTIERIGDLLELDMPALLVRSRAASTGS